MLHQYYHDGQSRVLNEPLQIHNVSILFSQGVRRNGVSFLFALNAGDMLLDEDKPWNV